MRACMLMCVWLREQLVRVCSFFTMWVLRSSCLVFLPLSHLTGRFLGISAVLASTLILNDKFWGFGVFNFVVCLYVYVYQPCAWCPQRPEAGLDTLELEVQMGVSCRVGAGKGTWVLEEQPVLLNPKPSLHFKDEGPLLYSAGPEHVRTGGSLWSDMLQTFVGAQFVALVSVLFPSILRF